jgi:hypothetical protein
VTPESSVWSQDYAAAFLEHDAEKLRVRITKTEQAIQQRRTELLQEASKSHELDAIVRALRVLTILRGISEKHE